MTMHAFTDTNFTLNVTVTDQNSSGVDSPATGSELVTVHPLAPTVSPVAASGVEGTPIPLDLGVIVGRSTGPDGDGASTNTLVSLLVSAIPLGAVLQDDDGHVFSAIIGGPTSVDIHTWDLSHLTITPDGTDDFVLGVSATDQDAEGNLSATTTATEAVTVTTALTLLAPDTSGPHLISELAGKTGDSIDIDSITPGMLSFTDPVLTGSFCQQQRAFVLVVGRYADCGAAERVSNREHAQNRRE